MNTSFNSKVLSSLCVSKASRAAFLLGGWLVWSVQPSAGWGTCWCLQVKLRKGTMRRVVVVVVVVVGYFLLQVGSHKEKW